MRPSLLLLTLLIGLSANAETLYRWTDAQGHIHFSDQPPAGTKKVQTKKYGAEARATAAASGNNSVTATLYVTTTCGTPCDSAREYLNRRGIVYTVRDPARDKDANQTLRANGDSARVPTLMLDNDKLEGFSEAVWSYALDKAGFPRGPGQATPQPGTDQGAPTPAPATPGTNGPQLQFPGT